MSLERVALEFVDLAETYYKYSAMLRTYSSICPLISYSHLF